jgi:hypothetical protein
MPTPQIIDVRFCKRCHHSLGSHEHYSGQGTDCAICDCKSFKEHNWGVLWLIFGLIILLYSLGII